jgi:hypothetical protein
VSGCTLGGHNWGIQQNKGATYNTIQYNRFYPTGQSNLVVSSAGYTFQHLLVQNNWFLGSVIEDGIQCDGSDPYVQDNYGVIFKDNIFGPALPGASLFAENCVDCKGLKYGVIEGNVMFGTIGSSDGQYGDAGWNRNAPNAITRGTNAYASHVLVRNNLIVDCCGGPTVFRRDSGDEYLAIYNNTFVGNNRDYTGTNSDHTEVNRRIFSGLRSREAVSGVVVVNNIFCAHNQAEIHVRTASGEPWRIDHNLYYNPDKTPVFSYDSPCVDVSGLPAWRTYLQGESQVEGNEANSQVANPLFANGPFRPNCEVVTITDLDYSLKATSPALNAGTYVSRCEDSGMGQTITVDRVQCFSDGFDRIGGDTIKVGSNDWVTVTNVDWDNREITVDTPITWSTGDEIYQYYYGTAPDLGAYQREA